MEHKEKQSWDFCGTTEKINISPLVETEVVRIWAWGCQQPDRGQQKPTESWERQTLDGIIWTLDPAISEIDLPMDLVAPRMNSNFLFVTRNQIFLLKRKATRLFLPPRCSSPLERQTHNWEQLTLWWLLWRGSCLVLQDTDRHNNVVRH